MFNIEKWLNVSAFIEVCLHHHGNDIYMRYTPIRCYHEYKYPTICSVGRHYHELIARDKKVKSYFVEGIFSLLLVLILQSYFP